MTVKETSAMHRRMNRLPEVMGTLLVDGLHYLALFAIGGAVVWSRFPSTSASTSP